MRDLPVVGVSKNWKKPTAVLLVSAGILWLGFSFGQFVAKRNSDVCALSPQIIEAAYPGLIAHVRGVASRGHANADDEASWNRLLPPEVLQITVGRDPGYIIVGQRIFHGIARELMAPPRLENNAPVLTQFKCQLEEGGEKTVALYLELVPLQIGPPREIRIIFDLEGLQSALVTKLENRADPRGLAQ